MYTIPMTTLFIMCGVGFSGKSTLAKEIAKRTGAILMSQDEEFFQKQKELNLNEDNDDDWDMVVNICKEEIRKLLVQGKSVVFDHTNLTFGEREKLREIATSTGAKAIVIFLNTPEEVQVQRQQQNLTTANRHQVKQEYLEEAKRELEIPQPIENTLVVTPDTNIDNFLSDL